MTQAQIPFLYAPFKRTDDIDWIRPLKRYISQVYQQDPENYNEETYTIHRLRQDIRGAGKDLTGRDLLYRYFGQLELLDLRFPVDEKHIKVLFTWYDAFNGHCTSQYSLAFEKASIIFNIATTLSAIAASQNRAEPDGRKRAFNFFQASAGMYQYINDNFLHAPSQDLHKDTVKLLMELMLAQAQECFLENSLREKKKDGLVAKLASHTAWVYGNLVDQINDAISRGVGIAKNWLVLCQCKQKYYQSLAQLHRAAACLSESLYGEQVARLQWAERLAKEGQKLALQLPQQSSQQSSQQSQWNNAAAAFMGLSSNGGDSSSGSSYNPIGGSSSPFPHDGGSCLNDLCTTLAALCSEKFAMAERDNDMIYHDQVPQESILVPIDRLKAVKAVAISDLYGAVDAGKVIGPDVFTRLIPLSVHESASMYSEEKASLVRRELERCDFAKAEMNASLDYMKLPGTLDKFKHPSNNSSQWNSSSSSSNSPLWDRFSTPPADVKKWADLIQSNETTDTLQSMLDNISGLANQNKSKLDQISLELDTEMGACESMRVKYGDDWIQLPSGTLTKDYRQDVRNHRDALVNAQLSDTQVTQKLDTISNDIAILKQGSSSQALESLFTDTMSYLLTESSSSVAPKDTVMDLQIDVGLGTNSMQQKLKRVESILEKLYKLQKDRDNTLEDLKEKTMKDDIAQLLILNKKNSNVERQIFNAQLEKYQSHQQRITAAIQHQKQVLQELSTAYKALMEMDEAQKLQSQWDGAERQYSTLVKRLNTAFNGYDEIKDALSNGIKFYTQLSDVIDSLLVNVEIFVGERKKERNGLIDTIEQARSTHEQQLLKDRLEQYQSPQQTQQESQQQQSSLQPQQQQYFATSPSTTSKSNEVIEDSENSIRDQLEQKMKDLSITTQPYTPPVTSTELYANAPSSLTPTSTYNLINNNHMSSLTSHQYIQSTPPPQQQQQQHCQPPPHVTPTSYQGNMTTLPSPHQRQTSYDQYQLPTALSPYSPTPSTIPNQANTTVIPSLPQDQQQQQYHHHHSTSIPLISNHHTYQNQHPQHQQPQKPMLPPKPQEVQGAILNSTLQPASTPTMHRGHTMPLQQPQQSMYGVPSQMTLQTHQQSGPPANNTSYHSPASTPSMMQPSYLQQYQQPVQQQQPYVSSTVYPSQGNGNYINQQQYQQPTYPVVNGTTWNQATPQSQQQQQQQQQQSYWPPLEPRPYSANNNQFSLLD
ncbi:BRO1-like domain-containing protein [Chlamydoabsidia padenii]|nr:BRO1-like domain-containing protein [Chlamydoabsidia padenii]